MPKRRNPGVFLSTIAAFALSLIVGPSLAQSPHDLVRPALVYLTAQGQIQSGPKASTLATSDATGFLVSKDGLVLTVYHLLEKLGDVAPDTVSIKAHLRNKYAQEVPVTVVDASKTTDLMLLKLPSDGTEYPLLNLGRAVTHDDNQQIFTSGFPNDSPYIKQKGDVNGRSSGFLWAISINFKQGQSGSPIYEEDGIVIGVAKGTDSVGVSGYMIPIGYADGLLAQVRLGELRDLLKDFEYLRRRLTWTAEAKDRASGTELTIRYEALVPGGPQVANIDVLIGARGIKDGVQGTLPEMPVKARSASATQELGKSFDLSPELAKLEAMLGNFGFASIVSLNLRITPNLEDGTQLPLRRIRVDLHD